MRADVKDTKIIIDTINNLEVSLFKLGLVSHGGRLDIGASSNVWYIDNEYEFYEQLCDYWIFV